MLKYLVISALAGILAACGAVTAGTPAQQQPVPSQQAAATQPAGVMAPQATRGVGMDQAFVTLNIFSGREPPTWSLPPADTQALIDLTAQLPPGNQPLPEGQLGYSGFVVKLPDPALAVSPTLTVYKDIVKYEAGSTTKLLSDPGRQIERLLVMSAETKLPADLYTTLKEQAGITP